MFHIRTFISLSLAVAATAVASANAQAPSLEAPAVPAYEPDYYDAEISLNVGTGTEVQIGDLRPGKLGTRDFSITAGLTLPAGEDWTVRYGILFQTRNFATEGRIPFASGMGLHALALELRATRALTDRTTLIIGVRPGSYGQEYNFSDDFSCPGLLSLGWHASDTFTLIGGVRYNQHGEYPLLPVFGVRWSPTSNFRAHLVFPRATVEYDWSENTTLYMVGSFDETVYQVDDARLKNFDEKRNQLADRLHDIFPDLELPPILTSDEFDYPTLVNTRARYRDIQMGLGIDWRLGESWHLELESGFSPERSLDFNNAGVRIDLRGTPTYYRLAFRGSF